MHRLLIIISLVLASIGVSAQNIADSLQISVLTCASGKEIYAAFGHSAFRIADKSKNFDRVYNYGTFNFRQPYFVLKFTRGFLDYTLSAYSYEHFEREYKRDGRKVEEQVLNLTSEQKLAILNFLEWNARPENRNYKYNFLEDNCATKMRDILKKSCGNDICMPDETYDFSLRDQINVRIADMPWFRLGISLLMGLPVDKKANSSSIQFLPDYVHEILSQTTISKNGISQPIVKCNNTLVSVDKPVDKTDILNIINPSLVFWLIFAGWALASFYEIKNRKKYKPLADRIFLFIIGLFGLLVFVMWFFTEHTVTAWNLNLIWTNPIHLVAAFHTRKTSGFWLKYFKVTACITGAMLVLGPIMPQQYDVAFYPVMATILLRLARIGFCDKKI